MRLFEILYMPDDIEYLVEVRNFSAGWVDSNSGRYIDNGDGIHIETVLNNLDEFGLTMDQMRKMCPDPDVDPDTDMDSFEDCVVSRQFTEWDPAYVVAYDNGWVRVYRNETSGYGAVSGHFNNVVSCLQNGSIGRFLKGFEGHIALSVAEGNETYAPWGRGMMSQFHRVLKELGGKS